MRVAPSTQPKKTVAKKKTASVKSRSTVRSVAKPKKEALPKTKTKKTQGIPEKLRDIALKILDERQGEEILTLDARDRGALADYVMVASGRSGRQLAAIAEHLRQAFLKNGAASVKVEGLPQGDWVLVDAGDVIVHLFRPEVRAYYALEDIWKKSKL